MTSCPECNTRLVWLQVMIMGPKSPVVCKGCGVSLKPSRASSSYNFVSAIIHGAIGIYFGFSLYLQPNLVGFWVGLVCIFISAGTTPVVLMKAEKVT